MKTLNISGKSYTVMLHIFKLLGFPIGVRILDMTYGRGRFYRRIKEVYKPFIIGIDIIRHEWEVEPDIFIQRDCRSITIDEVRQYGRIDVVVVDPPWNHVKRGYMSDRLGISDMPYHMPSTEPYQIIYAAMRIARGLGVPLVARFMEPICGADIVVRNSVSVFGSRGAVYYSIVLNQYEPLSLDRWVKRVM